MMSSSIELALRLGLKPYAEFERALADCLRRIAIDERNEILSKVYSLAAEKTIDEHDRKDTQEWAAELKNRGKSVQASRKHLARAMKELLAAKAKFHPELPRWFDVDPLVQQVKEIDALLADNEGVLDRMAAVLADPTGTRITHHDSYTAVHFIPEFGASEGYIFPGRGVTDLDDPFIAALDHCLGKRANGRRRRYDRDGLIAKVFELLGQNRSKNSITQARNRIRRWRRP